MKRLRLCMVVVFITGFTVHAPAQEPPPMPTPGPAHQVFKADEGTWDATVSENASGTRVMTAFTRGADGKEFQVLKITYTKRK